MRIYLDMDGVLVNLLAGWMPHLNDVTGKNLQPKDVDKWWLEEVYEVSYEVVEKPLHLTGFWENLPPYPGAAFFVKTLEDMGHDVYLATTPFPSDKCAWGKKMWVEKHMPWFPFNRLILIHDKHLLRGEMLVDDKPENLIAFQGHRVLYNQPWNQTLTTGLIENWFTRVSTYTDILATLGRPY